MKARKFLRIVKNAIQMYSIYFLKNLYLTISVSVSLLLFLAVALFMDFKYANYSKSYSKIQTNYIASQIYDDKLIEDLTFSLSRFDYILLYHVNGSGNLSKNGKAVEIDYNIIASDCFYRNIWYRNNLPVYDNPANAFGFSKFEMKAGRDSFTSPYEVIISSEFASLLSDEAQDVIGMRISMGIDGADQIYTIVGVYNSILEETRLNKPIFQKINAGKDFDEHLNFTVFMNQDALPNQVSPSADLYVFFDDEAEQSAVLSVLRNSIKNEGSDMNGSYLSPEYIKYDLQTEYASMTSTKALIMLIVAVISGISVFGTMQNSIADRKQEIGIKKALGASDMDIMVGLLVENIVNALIAMFLSISLASSVSLIFVAYMRRRALTDYVIWIYPSTIILFVAYSFSVIVGFSLIPAYKATQINIVDSIRDE